MACERKLEEACGLVGVAVLDAESLDGGVAAVRGLEQLQHRGHESSGLVGSTALTDHFAIHKGLGLVREVYTEASLAAFRDSRLLVGHNRYSTAGVKDAINCVQPFVVHTAAGTIAVAHNGQLVNAAALRREVLASGVGMSTDTDSELIAQLLAKALALSPAQTAPEDLLGSVMLELMASGKLSLSYSLLLMSRERLYAVRDPFGNRPLAIGAVKGDQGQTTALVVASESCAFAALGADFLREVGPGEVVELSPYSTELRSRVAVSPLGSREALCIFEFVYFARASSVIGGEEVNAVRTRCGRRLAVEAGVEADVVSTVPDSAAPAALGFALQAGLPFRAVLNKNSYVGRTFIQPSEALRQAAVRRKFTAIGENVRGQRVVLVDDSIVRGNTMRPIVKLLRAHGAKEVHLRIASPAIKSACHYGINIPNSSELIAHKLGTEEEIRDHVGADSLRYLSIQGLVAAVRPSRGTSEAAEAGLCTGCLDQRYPVAPAKDIEDLCDTTKRL